MYIAPQEVSAANDALWVYLRDYLDARGVADLPPALDRDIAYDAVWHEANLVLAQACGLPYAKTLRGVARIIATPCYSYPGCVGPTTCSFIIARKGAGVARLEDLRGTRAAINSRESNSGTNEFRAAIAPLAGGRPFFASVMATGGHAASIAAVAEGRADCAAIDCVTFGHLQRFAPDRLAAVEVIAETPSGPGLPFITRASASDAEVGKLRDGLAAMMADPAMAAVRDTLALTGFAPLVDADYDDLVALEEDAKMLGYSELA